MRTLLAFVLLSSSELLTGQGLFFNEIWPPDRSAGTKCALLIENPYAIDAYRIFGSSSVRRNKFTFVFEGQWLQRKSFSQPEFTLWTGHRIADHIGLFTGATIRITHSAETKFHEWQASLGIEIALKTTHVMILAHNILPGLQNHVQSPFNLQFFLTTGMGANLSIQSRLSMDGYKVPDLDLQLTYELNNTWSLHPVIHLWPIQIGMGVSCSISGGWTAKLGSQYDIRLGPSPILGAVYSNM